jgi:hypothetical protein
MLNIPERELPLPSISEHFVTSDGTDPMKASVITVGEGLL